MAIHPYKDTGDKIKEVRTAIPDLTQKKLADAVGVHCNYLAMLERGEKPLTEGLAYKIGKVCSVHPDYLMLRSDKMNVGIPVDIGQEHEASVALNPFIDYISKKAGYSIERVQFQSDEIPDDLRERVVCKFCNGSADISVSSGAIKDYFDDVESYAVMRLNRLLEKEGSGNG